jgi:DNA-binding NtrC family response regulator
MKPRPNIQLIEDDLSIAASLEKELRAEGYDVAIATRGDEGLDAAVKDPCDLVITDLKMPGLSGLQLVEKLHSAKPKLPIIMITAFGTTETAIEATKLGAYDYLLKPFDTAELLSLVASAVASKRMMSEPLELGRAEPSQSAIVGSCRAMQARCWKVSCSATSGALSPALMRVALAGSSKPIEAQSSWTKSET